MGIEGCFREEKWLGRDADHSPHLVHRLSHSSTYTYNFTVCRGTVTESFSNSTVTIMAIIIIIAI
jgi:hypothetical protein